MSNLIAMADRLWQAIQAEDETALAALLVPGQQLWLVWDLWGWPGLQLITGWSADARNQEVVFDGHTDTAPTLSLRWEIGSGKRRAVILSARTGDEEPLFLEALPSDAGAEIAPALIAAMKEGRTPAWRAAPPDLTEGKLRQAIVARRYPMENQMAIINTWRQLAPLLAIAEGKPDAWAAAVEGGYWQNHGREMTLTQMAGLYGAHKGEVKRCFSAIVAASAKL